jgi:hypothetical protein
VVRSRNHCCYGNAKIGSYCIVIAVNVAANNIKVIAIEMQGWVPLTPMSSDEIFRTTLNKNVTHYLRYPA